MTRKAAGSWSDWLIYFFAGPELGDAIAGDLREQSATDRPYKRTYKLAFVRSLPGLIQLGWRHVSPKRIGIEAVFAALALALISAWEVLVARVYAWPLAVEFFALSPLSITATCKLAYLVLFSIGMSALLVGWFTLNATTQPSWRVRAQRLGSCSIAGLAPTLILLLNPGPHDGDPLFRYIQIASIALIGLVTATCCRARLKPA
ncbi:MAG: hypothetical protein ACX94B_16030 [Henriciella sp.]